VMMREGKPSPDDVDGLACTFAYPLNRNERRGGDEHMPAENLVQSEYNPYSAEQMAA
jgi:hypothetical protein